MSDALNLSSLPDDRRGQGHFLERNPSPVFRPRTLRVALIAVPTLWVITVALAELMRDKIARAELRSFAPFYALLMFLFLSACGLFGFRLFQWKINNTRRTLLWLAAFILSLAGLFVNYWLFFLSVHTD